MGLIIIITHCYNVAIYLRGLIIIDSQAIVRHRKFTSPRISLGNYETIVLHLVYRAKRLSNKIIKHRKKKRKMSDQSKKIKPPLHQTLNKWCFALVMYLDASYCDLVISVINLATYLYKEASYEASRTTGWKHKQEIVKIEDEDCDSVPLQVL